VAAISVIDPGKYPNLTVEKAVHVCPLPVGLEELAEIGSGTIIKCECGRRWIRVKRVNGIAGLFSAAWTLIPDHRDA
jgi:hypothetical protein